MFVTTSDSSCETKKEYVCSSVVTITSTLLWLTKLKMELLIEQNAFKVYINTYKSTLPMTLAAHHDGLFKRSWKKASVLSPAIRPKEHQLSCNVQLQLTSI